MDKIDKSILESLQKNARIKNSTLARTLDLPPTTLQERIKRLEKNKIIKGYRAEIGYEKLGLNVQAFVAVTLNRHEPNDIREFEKGIRNLPNIRECFHLSGRFDYLLHVMVKDLPELGELVKKGITALPDFGRCETFLVFSEVKSNGDWLLDPPSLEKSDQT